MISMGQRPYTHINAMNTEFAKALASCGGFPSGECVNAFLKMYSDFYSAYLYPTPLTE
jgi:hypothetical protein